MKKLCALMAAVFAAMMCLWPDVVFAADNPSEWQWGGNALVMDI